MRYIGHIINLIIQAFFFKDKISIKTLKAFDINDLTQELGLQEASQEQADGEKLAQEQLKKEANMRKLMRALGALRKLHNLAVHIRSSAGRASVFRALTGRLLPIDNRTRQNSWSTMLTVAYEKQVAITRYQSDFEEEIKAEDILQAPTNWKELQAI